MHISALKQGNNNTGWLCAVHSPHGIFQRPGRTNEHLNLKIGSTWRSWADFVLWSRQSQRAFAPNFPCSFSLSYETFWHAKTPLRLDAIGPEPMNFIKLQKNDVLFWSEKSIFDISFIFSWLWSPVFCSGRCFWLGSGFGIVWNWCFYLRNEADFTCQKCWFVDMIFCLENQILTAAFYFLDRSHLYFVQGIGFDWGEALKSSENDISSSRTQQF